MRKLKKYKPTRFMAKTSHYDKDAADYAVMFIESLCHTKGTWAGKPFELIDWQEQIIRDPVSYTHLDVYKRQVLGSPPTQKTHLPCRRFCRRECRKNTI